MAYKKGKVDTADVTRKTVRAIKRLGRSGAHFKTHEIREDLKYPEDSPEAHYMHNVVNRLKRNAALVTVGGDRKRNQYLRINDESKLDQAVLRASTRSPRPMEPTPVDENGNGGAPDRPAVGSTIGPPRVVYLEDRVDGVEQALTDVRDDIRKGQDDLRAQVEAMSRRLDDLVELWS